MGIFKILKRVLLGALILITVLIGMWWINLPYHSLPVEYESRKSALNGIDAELHPTFFDVSYGESPFQKFDLFLPKTVNKPYPVVVWIHGGGLIMGDKSSLPRTDFGPAPVPTSKWGPYQVQVPDIAELTANGYAVVSLNYRLGMTPVTAAKNAVKDCKNAIRFLRNNAQVYGLDPERFAVWGNSMGGYLSAMVGITGNHASSFEEEEIASSAVQAVIVWYGAEDRMPGNLSLYEQIAKSNSIPPFYIVNGDADPVVSAQQAQKLHQALEQAGATSHVTILEGAGHEDPIFMQSQIQPAVTFLNQVLRSN